MHQNNNIYLIENDKNQTDQSHKTNATIFFVDIAEKEDASILGCL